MRLIAGICTVIGYALFFFTDDMITFPFISDGDRFCIGDCGFNSNVPKRKAVVRRFCQRSVSNKLW